MRNGVKNSAKLKKPKEIPKSKNNKGGKQHVVAKMAVQRAVKTPSISFFIYNFSCETKL